MSQNTRAFVAPLIASRKTLRDIGVEVRLFTSAAAWMADCDVLLVTSKYYGSRWARDSMGILIELAEYASRAGTLVYCDIHDSSGLVRTEVLPHVQMYLKSYLLVDRKKYAQLHYGGRLYTDYYYRNAGVQDREPTFSDPISDPAELEKLQVSWNMGLANYGRLGSRIAALHARLPIASLLRMQPCLHQPQAPRAMDLTCRFGKEYDRETVAHQRWWVHEKLRQWAPSGAVSRGKYFREMRQAKVVPSPFGWGEFALRDYEAFVCGAALFKPDMSHLETYPDYYRDGETMVAHRWDLRDFDEKLQHLLSDESWRIRIAEGGQEAYRYHACTSEGREAFVVRLISILRSAQVNRVAA